MDPDIRKIAQVVAIAAAFMTFAVTMWIIVRVVLSASRRPSVQPPAVAPTFDDSRFSRLEEAVDSIALEVERIAEAQRFTAKLMSERLPDRLAAGPAASTREI